MEVAACAQSVGRMEMKISPVPIPVEKRRGGPRGAENPSSKLTEDEVREIRRLRKAGHSLNEIAKQFRVGRTTIRNIAAGRKWRWLAD